MKAVQKLNSINSQHQFSYDVDSNLLPDGTMSRVPMQIHDLLTETNKKYFVCSQQDKHSPPRKKVR